ncbi:hypothetical protein ACIRBX_07905 [Kitasatospora sp. NPDC096147]|uniref:hypothetical protein n=1 Tax=Kitasatospora sp. NPDC096147 TaxID=3364093 RepID=UPI003828CC6A
MPSSLTSRIDGLSIQHPHRPLLLLWAIDQALRGRPRLQHWSVIREETDALLAEYGRSDGALYPFWVLHLNGLWEIEGAGTLPLTSGGRRPLVSALNAPDPLAGLPPEDHALLLADRQLADEITESLLERHLDPVPAGVAARIGWHGPGPADEVVVSPSSPEQTAARYRSLKRSAHASAERRGEDRSAPVGGERPKRTRSARRAVLLRSGGRCENPGCLGHPDELTDRGAPLLEVDHLNGLAATGEDVPELMIALCPNCHALKGRGRHRHRLLEVLAAAVAEKDAALERLGAGMQEAPHSGL